MANKYTQMFFTELLAYTLHAHTQRTSTFEKQKEMDSKLESTENTLKWMNKRTNKENTCSLPFTRIRIVHTSTNTHILAPLTHMAELLTRIIAITLNWYYRWQNIEKSCWDRFWLILSSFTIITHIDAILPRHFDNFDFSTHFIGS